MAYTEREAGSSPAGSTIGERNDMQKLDWALRVESIEPWRGYPPRSEWGDGPWQNEPDLIEWRDEAGMPCLIVRGPLGALCGYVGLGPEHPYSGTNHNDLPDLEVHGGLTFSEGCHEGGHICHVAREGEPEQVWWLGFDCNHSGDVDPAVRALLRSLPGYSERWEYGTYRDIHYVRGEVESLARQLRAVPTDPPEPSEPCR